VRRGNRTQALGWALAALAVLLLIPALVLIGLNASHLAAGRILADAVFAIAVVIYAGAGRLITRRVPRNAIGWLLAAIGVSLAATSLTEQYALYGLATAPGSLPAVRLAGWLAGVTFLLTFTPMPFLVLLFPDGRLPSRRWRPVLWAMLAVLAGWLAQQFQAGTDETGGPTNALVAAGVSYPNPLGIFPRHGWFSDLLAMLVPVGLAAGVLVVVSVFARRRGANAELRKQLAWLGYVGLLVVIPVVPFVVYGTAVHGHVSSALGTLFWGYILIVPTIGIPVACGVAVLKYRLYEIDKIISRTLSYAIVTGLLVGVYAGLVLLATEVLRFHSTVAVAVSTLAAAALFTPLRSRVQRLVDRRFNRTRYDADQTLTAFAARLKEAVDSDAVRADLLGVIHRSLEPTHATVWVRPHR
jgi:MFS family permease